VQDGLRVLHEEGQGNDELATDEDHNQHRGKCDERHSEGHLHSGQLGVILEKRVLQVRGHGVKEQEAPQQDHPKLLRVHVLVSLVICLKAEDDEGRDDDESLGVVNEPLLLASHRVHHEDRQELRGLRRRLQGEGDVGQALVLAPRGYEVGASRQADCDEAREDNTPPMDEQDAAREQHGDESVEEH